MAIIHILQFYWSKTIAKSQFHLCSFYTFFNFHWQSQGTFYVKKCLTALSNCRDISNLFNLISKLQLKISCSAILILLIIYLKQKGIRLTKASFSRECEDRYRKPQRSGATLHEKSQEPNGHIFVDSPSIRRRNSTWKVLRKHIDFERRIHVEVMISIRRGNFYVDSSFKIDKTSMSVPRGFFYVISTSDRRNFCTRCFHCIIL